MKLLPQVPKISKKNYSLSSAVRRKIGAGCGNVHDQMLPSSKEESNMLFRHTKRPMTASIIGYDFCNFLILYFSLDIITILTSYNLLFSQSAPMTFGQPFVGTVSLLEIFALYPAWV